MDTCPEGRPLRDGLKQACLATGHHAEVSALSSRGNRCIPYPGHYSPAFAFSAILYPQQMRLILQPDWSHLAARLCDGLTLFHAMSTSQEDPTFLPVIVLSACPHQAGKHPITNRLVRACQSIWLVKLDGIYQWFTFVGPLTQPCASSGLRLPESHDNPHGRRTPTRVATLSVRSARGRYQPRTAPRLLAAERQVAYTLPRGQQLITRFAPRTQPTSALWAEAAAETAAFFYAFRHDVLANVSPGLLFHT